MAEGKPNKYDIFMQHLVAELDGTWLAQNPIIGSTQAKITQAEQTTDKQIPAALKAWYRVAGDKPPYTGWHNDYSLKDFNNAQDVAKLYLEHFDEAEQKIASHLLAFSEILADTCLYVDTNHSNSDDPPVFVSIEGDTPQVYEVSFTSYIRETLIFDLEPSDNIHRYSKNDSNYIEIGRIRKQLIQAVHQQDILRDSITGIEEFQKHWLTYEPLMQFIKTQDFSIPYNWSQPPQRPLSED